MRYTPVELRHLKLSRGFRGYKRDDTDRAIEDIADSFEEVWRERGELADKLEEVERRLEEAKEREGLLASTLVAAERVAAEAREAAKREAELILAEAHGEARSVTRLAQAERERLFAEARRVEAQLRAALGMIEQPDASAGTGGTSSTTPLREHWPRRDDTREFEAIEPPTEAAPPESAQAPPAPGEAPTALPEPPMLPPVAQFEAGSDTAGPWAGSDFAWG
jgi:cell division initiation protein